MTVLVTGATGFLGRRLVRRLLEQGISVRCLVRPSSRINEFRNWLGLNEGDRLELQIGLLNEPDVWQTALAGVETVYHLAASLTGNWSEIQAQTVEPTRRLLEACCETNLLRLVHVSSLGVYGAGALQPGSVLDESTPLEAHPEQRDDYTRGKLQQEELCWQSHQERGLPLVVMRPGVVFGGERGVLSHRMGLSLGGWLIRMGGDQILPYTYVDNCANAILLAGIVEGIDGEAFNVVDDDLPTAEDIWNWYRSAGGRRRTIQVPRSLIVPLSGLYELCSWCTFGRLPPILSRERSRSAWGKLTYSNSKAKERLGWSPRIGMREAVQCTLHATRS